MENAASQAVARTRRPVRCRNCGNVFTPVSGFCPNCLKLSPLGRRIGVVPIVAILGLVALGAIVFAASSPGGIALRPAANQVGASSTPTSASPSPVAAQSAAATTPAPPTAPPPPPSPPTP